MSKDWYRDVIQFCVEVKGDSYPDYPHIPELKDKTLWKKLVGEEIQETLTAIREDNLVKIADGIADSIVVLLGTAVCYGIDMRPIWNEVHKTNMAKKGGIIREDGKLLKPPGWIPPDIKRLLDLQRNQLLESTDNIYQEAERENKAIDNLVASVLLEETMRSTVAANMVAIKIRQHLEAHGFSYR